MARRRRSWSVFRQLSLCGAGVVFAVGWEVVRLAVGQQLPPLALVSDDGCRTQLSPTAASNGCWCAGTPQLNDPHDLFT